MVFIIISLIGIIVCSIYIHNDKNRFDNMNDFMKDNKKNIENNVGMFGGLVHGILYMSVIAFIVSVFLHCTS